MAIKYFNKPVEVTRSNIDKFLGNRFDSDMTLIVTKNTKGSADYKEQKARFQEYYYHPFYSQNVLFVSLNDNIAVDRFGMHD